MKVDEARKYEHGLARAFMVDLESLLRQFEEKQSFTFDSFAEVWKGKDFSLIYGGQTHSGELKIFTEMCFSIIVKYVMHPRSEHTQAGALYALYGMYYKQPFHHFVKIRLSHEQFRSLEEFINKMRQKEQFEVLYVYGKLRADNAFLYVANEKAFGLETKFSMYFEVSPQEMFKEDSIKNLKEMVEDEELEELDRIDKEYKSAMQMFLEKHPTALLSMFDSDVTTELKTIVQEHLEANEAVEDNTILSRRRKLRKKVQDNIGQTYKVRKLKENVGGKFRRKRREKKIQGDGGEQEV